MLEDGERVEADDAYIGEAPLYVKCPNSLTCPEEQAAIRRRIQGRHELMNRRLKHYDDYKLE